jgi:hypothetical protein
MNKQMLTEFQDALFQAIADSALPRATSKALSELSLSGRWPDMGTPETRLTMCDLRVTHFMCAKNFLFNMMYTTTPCHL